jgi:hypothetical protein
MINCNPSIGKDRPIHRASLVHIPNAGNDLESLPWTTFDIDADDSMTSQAQQRESLANTAGGNALGWGSPDSLVQSGQLRSEDGPA